MNYRDQINKGIAVLDVIKPGWFTEIDLNSVNVRSAFDCVLGQLFGSYSSGSIAVWNHVENDNLDCWLPEMTDVMNAHGFTLNRTNEVDYMPYASPEWFDISTQWMAAINDLRDVKA